MRKGGHAKGKYLTVPLTHVISVKLEITTNKFKITTMKHTFQQIKYILFFMDTLI